METTISEPRLLTTAEVATTLRISETRVRELVAEGVLRAIRLGGRGSRLRFRRADIERLIEGEAP